MTHENEFDDDLPQPPVSRPPRAMRLLGWGLFVLALLGLIPTTLLAQQSYRLGIKSPYEGGLCEALGASCTGALTSAAAKFEGITLSYAGLAWYAGLATFMLLGLLASGRGRLGWPSAPWVALALLAGVMASVPAGFLVFDLLTATDYEPCPLCLATHSITFTFTSLALVAFILDLTLRALHAGKAKLLGGTGERDAVDAAGRTLAPRYALASVLASAAIAGAVMMVPHYMEIREQHLDTSNRLALLMERPDVKRELMLDGIRALPEEVRLGIKSIPLPGQGNVAAPIRIIEVSDFGCPKCREMHPQIEKLLKDYGDLVRLEFLSYPIDRECNPYVNSTGHETSCEAHMAAMAAERQNKFYPYATLLFANQNRFAEAPWDELAARLKLDLPQFRKDREDPELWARLVHDLDIAYKAGVRGTPRYLLSVNGSPVEMLPTNFSPEEIFQFAAERLAAKPPAADPTPAETPEKPAEPARDDTVTTAPE